MLPARLGLFFLLFVLAGNAAYKIPGFRVAEPPAVRATATGRVQVLTLGRLTEEERRRLNAVGSEQRAGVRRKLPEDAVDEGTWSTLADGRGVWRLKIRSVDATGMRVEFSDFSVGDSKVWVNSEDSTDGPYIGRGPNDDGKFWSGTVGGESAVIEYEVEPGGRVGGPPPFRILHVAHEERRPAQPPQPKIAFTAVP